MLLLIHTELVNTCALTPQTVGSAVDRATLPVLVFCKESGYGTPSGLCGTQDKCDLTISSVFWVFSAARRARMLF